MEKFTALLNMAGNWLITTMHGRVLSLVIVILVAALAFDHFNPNGFTPVVEKVQATASAVGHKAETLTHTVVTDCIDGYLTIDGNVVNDGIGNPVSCECQVVIE